MSSCTFDSMARFTARVFEHFGWNSVVILYNEFGQSEVVQKFCYLAVSAIVKEMYDMHDVDVRTYGFDLETDADEEEEDPDVQGKSRDESIETILKKEVGGDHSSKQTSIFCCFLYAL